MIKLYYAPDTCALASHIALEEAGAEYAVVRIDFAREEIGSRMWFEFRRPRRKAAYAAFPMARFTCSFANPAVDA